MRVHGHGLERGERLLHGPDVGVGRAFPRAADGGQLDQVAQLVDGRQVIEVHAGHDRRPPGRGDDQSLRLQLTDRLTDRDVADSHPVLQLTHPHRLTGLQLTAEDRVSQLRGGGVR